MIAAVGVALILGGCGGGGGGSQKGGGEGKVTVQTGSLSKAQFIKRADAICKAALKKSQEEFIQYGQEERMPITELEGPKQKAQAKDFIDAAFAPIFQKQIDDIRALGAPANDEKKISAILTSMQEGLEEAEKKPLPFIHGARFLEDASRLARVYGLEVCSV